VKTSTFKQLKSVRDKYGPGIFGKITQKLLALAFYEGGFAHVVERGVQGVDIDIKDAKNAYAVEVKTTDGQSIPLSKENIDALKDRSKDGYVPIVAVLRLQMFEDWIFAAVPLDRLRAATYPVNWFRSYRLTELEKLVSPHFENIVDKHGRNVVQRGERYLGEMLERTDKETEASELSLSQTKPNIPCQSVEKNMKSESRGYIPLLSKSRFISGLQCYKRLYLECFHPELASPPSEQQQAVFDTGNEFGAMARKLFPRGLLIEEEYFRHDDAMKSTQLALADPQVPTIYEAAFRHDDVRTRIDILTRNGEGSYDLVEVKSSTQVKEEYIPDVGIQLYILNGSGIDIGRTCLGFVNKEYVYPGGEYDLSQLICIEDITDTAHGIQSDIPQLLETMRNPLWSTEVPKIKTGRQCSKPYECSFYAHCHADEPEHHVGQLPRASEKLLQSLEEAGIGDIRNIPIEFTGLNSTQQRVRDCVVNNRFHLDSELPQALRQLEYPIHFLDFETFNPALPIYVGTRPYQIIPFQWSNHILEESGELRHEEFLHEGADDPREPFARSLLQTLGTNGSIVVYSSFEAARIRELAAAFSSLSADLLELLESRVVDLLQLVRKHCYHPEFHGSFSIKSVLPALVPDLDYKDLEINDGGMASVVYTELRRLETMSDRRDFLRKCLLKYCERDTEAEVRLFTRLLGYS